MKLIMDMMTGKDNVHLGTVQLYSVAVHLKSCNLVIETRH